MGNKEKEKKIIIAISGPAASGKGTLARMLAKKLDLPHYDFGLMFRAISFLSSHYGIDQLLRFAIKHQLKIKNEQIWFLGSNLTSTIKSEKVGLVAAQMACTDLSSMIQIAQAMVKHNNFVCDGRTCGSEIYPDAEYKFYITAKEKDRIRRRHDDGGNINIFSKREQLDYNRLKIPLGAIVINTSGKTKEKSLQQLLSFIK